MDELDVADFVRTCRACLLVGPELVLHPLTIDGSVHRIYTKFTSLEVTKADGLPQNICSQCLDQCENGKRFKALCEANETKLLLALAADGEEKELGAQSPCETISEDIRVYAEPFMEDASNCLESGPNDGNKESPVNGLKEYWVNCQYCGKARRGASNFEAHIKEEHSHETVHECIECGLSYKSKYDFKYHMYKHSEYGARPIATELNKRNFDEIEAVAVDKDSATIKCQFCLLVFKSIQAFQKHIKNHRNDKDFSCKDCPSKFVDKTKFKDHMFTHSGFVFPCRRCDKILKSPAKNKSHLLICRQVDPVDNVTSVKLTRFVCDICGAGYAYQHSLAVHKTSHTDERPFGCEICGKRLKTHQAYQDHKLRHTDKRKFHCEPCNKAYFFKAELNEHMRRKHSSVRPFLCTECGRAFLKACLLREHMRIHTGDLPFACDLCEEKFRTAYKLKTHKDKIHVYIVNVEEDEKV